jgi:hypothetical protein
VADVLAAMSLESGVGLIERERLRQIKKEGWRAEHDDEHDMRELALAALSYVDAHANPDEYAEDNGKLPGSRNDWPWDEKWWKPSKDPVRNLVKAGALIAAEIDRLLRIQRKEPRAEKKRARRGKR